MYQLMQRILSDPKEINTKVTLIYANKTENDILLRPELEKLERQYPDRLKIYCTLDHPPTDSDWKGGRGYVSREMVVKYLPEPRTNHAANSGVFVFVSGPEA
jgi:cytochrome-b5 reductase